MRDLDNGFPVYIWEVTVPMNVEHKFYHACLMSDIDIYDEYELFFVDYVIRNILGLKGRYALLELIATDEKICKLSQVLNELNVPGIDIYMTDELPTDKDDYV